MANENVITNDETENHFKNVKNQNKFLKFTLFDLICPLFSLSCLFTDLITDLILILSYICDGHYTWAFLTFLLTMIPSLLVQFFSLRWYKYDKKSLSYYDWISHFFLLGLSKRYVELLKNLLYNYTIGIKNHKICLQQSDICMLHLFECFLESAPQLVLQLYIMVSLNEWKFLTGLSAIASLCSLSWSIAAYTRAMRLAQYSNKNLTYSGLLFQALWRAGMLSARIAALVLCALMFESWVFILILVHWLAMTGWVLNEKTDFCPTVWEERIYNCVVGVIYCFCYFNVTDGNSRYRITTFYSIIVTQNIFLLIFTIIVSNHIRQEILIVAFVIIIVGTIVGIGSMIIYYLKFHPSGPIRVPFQLQKVYPLSHININNKKKSKSSQICRSNTVRSLKNPWNKEWNDYLEKSNQNSQQHLSECTDKKLLLDNCFVRSVTPMFQSASISPTTSTVEFCSVKDLFATNENEKSTPNQKLPQNDKDQSKRRCIYSKNDLNDIYDEVPKFEFTNEKNGFDQINFSNTISKRKSIFLENLLLNEPALSEILSAHDYENICAVNVAREKWGLRSWKGYFDIETYYHDDSVVYDRRRDTITSYSSDFSSNSRESPISIIRRRNLDECSEYSDMQDMKSDDSTSLYLAKPYIIDQFGSLYPIVVPLEPILEEVEDYSSSNSDTIIPFKENSSASTLVATINEIRMSSSDSPFCKKTIWDINSPKNNKNLSKRYQKQTFVKSLNLYENHVDLVNENKKSNEDSFWEVGIEKAVDPTSKSNENFFNVDHKSGTNFDGQLNILKPSVFTTDELLFLSKLKTDENLFSKKEPRKIMLTNSCKLTNSDTNRLDIKSTNELTDCGFFKTNEIKSNVKNLKMMNTEMKLENIKLDLDHFKKFDDTSTNSIIPCDDDILNVNNKKTRRKFSILREKFERKSSNSIEKYKKCKKTNYS